MRVSYSVDGPLARFVTALARFDAMCRVAATLRQLRRRRRAANVKLMTTSTTSKTMPLGAAAAAARGHGGQGISFAALLAYTEGETRRWHQYLAALPPAVLDEPMGEGKLATLRGLLVHIFAVELRYAQRLSEEPVSSYESLPQGSLDEIFAISSQAREKLARYLASATDADLARVLTFETLTAGTQRASARKIVGHALIHGIRHWAQISTVLRQRGYPGQWFHDLLMSEGME